MKTCIAVCVLLCFAASLRAEEVKIAAYNIEMWSHRFDSRAMTKWAKTQPKSDELTELVKKNKEEDDKGNWEVATVIQAMNPDIMLFEEGCSQDDLEYFNKRWLGGAYATLKVFPNNSGRDQNVGIIAKPGFKVLKVMDDYYKEPDTVAKDWLKNDPEEQKVAADNRLFARGPGFILFQTPGGKQLWVGVNHEKSKHGNSIDVAKWRTREALRMHQIILDLQKQGPADVVFGGDMNDELGLQEFEQEAGGDSIALIQGPAQDGVILATKPLADKGEFSFGGYYNTRFRSLIDHFFVTKSLKDNIEDVSIFKAGLAPAASDHYPVVLTLKF